VKTEPLPGSLVAVTSPPIMRASLRVMARPSPVPPGSCYGACLRSHDPQLFHVCIGTPRYSANFVLFVGTCTPPIPTTAGVTEAADSPDHDKVLTGPLGFRKRPRGADPCGADGKGLVETRLQRARLAGCSGAGVF
jgi:hypothetical protein